MDTPSQTPSEPEPERPRRRGRRIVRNLLLIVIGALTVVTLDLWTALGRTPKGEHRERISTSPQWKGDFFDNALPTVDPRLPDVLRAYWGNDATTSPNLPPPVLDVHPDSFATPPTSGLRLTWIGHSTFIIEIDGRTILTDPVWGPRASPSSIVGPTRFHDPPIAIDDLPPLDAVVISHDHYDHLDLPSIRALAERDVRFFVPLGVGSHLEYWGVPSDRIVEHDWWDETPLGDVRVVATPSRHFSGRRPGGRNSTLWCSWSLVGPDNRVFFSGDSALFPGFADIGARLGPFDVTLMENGAYNEMWADVHMGPEQAIAAHRMVRGGLLVPIHWGTFNLALHSWVEPAERIIAAARDADVKLAVPRIGQQFEPASPPLVERWWPAIDWKPATAAPVVSSGLDARVLDLVPTPR